jgi:cytochrome c553
MNDPRAPGETFEPYEEHRGIPLPVLWIAIALALWGAVILYHNNRAVGIARVERADAAQVQAEDTPLSGAAIFAARCSTCHQPNAVGVSGAIPPLSNSPFAAAKPEVVAQILLHGIDGPIAVDGATFDGHMPSFASVLSDDDLARVANHVRKTWGGARLDMDAAFVARERARFPARGAWAGGAEIAATLDAMLPPQPSPVAGQAPPTDPATLTLVTRGAGDIWACASCHGVRGEGRGNVPRLAGLPAEYIAKQLGDFSAVRRDNETMTLVARSLTPAQMQSLGRYYATIRTPSAARPELGGDIVRGETLALQGDWTRGMPACFSCHGPSGFGVAPDFPALAAQHPSYTAGQLAAWRGGTRRNSPVEMMNRIAVALGDADRRAVADYLATLPPVPAAAPKETTHGRSGAR